MSPAQPEADWFTAYRQSRTLVKFPAIQMQNLSTIEKRKSAIQHHAAYMKSIYGIEANLIVRQMTNAIGLWYWPIKSHDIKRMEQNPNDVWVFYGFSKDVMTMDQVMCLVIPARDILANKGWLGKSDSPVPCIDARRVPAIYVNRWLPLSV